jgi:hypothetical protein
MMRTTFWRPVACFALLVFMCIGQAQAHKPSDSYLTLTMGANVIHGQWDIALRDLDFAIGLDADNNGDLSWDEVRNKHKDIAAYALARLAIVTNEAGVDQVCALTPGKQMLDQHTDGTYTVLYFEAACPNPTSVKIAYKLLFDLDPQHKGLLKLTNAAGLTTTAIFSPDSAQQNFILAETSKWRQFQDYVLHGVEHIWIGIDHILFLLSLLLPAVLLSQNKRWVPVDSAKAATIDVLKIVTAFTLAHSITLTLATLQVISLPSRWVESAIAFSVILAALNNLLPLFRGRRWLVAFGFGLIHGFGFASVLADLGLPQASLLLALVGFNVGVELGQVAIVAAFLPLAFALRKSWFYQKCVLSFGSGLIVLIASVWLIERLFDLRLISR